MVVLLLFSSSPGRPTESPETKVPPLEDLFLDRE